MNRAAATKGWPPPAETATLIRRKLEEARFRESDLFERFRTRFFRPEEPMGPSITEICADRMANEGTRTGLESCGADRWILPPMPVRSSGVS